MKIMYIDVVEGLAIFSRSLMALVADGTGVRQSTPIRRFIQSSSPQGAPLCTGAIC